MDNNDFTHKNPYEIVKRKFTELSIATLYLMGLDLPEWSLKHHIPLNIYSPEERTFLDKVGVVDVYVMRNQCNTLNGYIKILANKDTIREFYLYDIEARDSIEFETNDANNSSIWLPEEITYCRVTEDDKFAILGFDTCHLCDREKYGIDDQEITLQMPLKEAYQDMINRARKFALGISNI